MDEAMKKKLAIVLMPVICALAALTVWGEGKPAGSLQLESANKTVQTTQTTVLDECNSSDEVQQILSQADQRRESIRNSETTIVKSNVFIKGETYTGTAYYVSNNGSDRNNGRSPRNAFATPAALERVNLKYGDAVFFERGSVWRGVTLPPSVAQAEGVTFSAYGEGPKPQFLGSLENGTGAEKWSLAYEGPDGRKIWVYYKEMTEVAGIVLNGQTKVRRDKPYWNGSQYVEIENLYWPREGMPLYTVEEDLPDMYCFPALQYPTGRQGAANDRIYHNWNPQTQSLEYIMGKLYFRCDAGNPGELYGEIEFVQPFPFVDGYANDQVYDNLCLLYSAMGMVSGYWNGVSGGQNSVVQNMEVGFMGGGVVEYLSPEEVQRIEDSGPHGHNNAVRCNGGCLAFNGSGITVRNNYAHDAYHEGIAMELFEGAPSMVHNAIYGNLIERCTQAILLCNWDREVRTDHIFSDFRVEDNLVLYSGQDSWFITQEDKDFCSAVVLQGGPCAHDGSVWVRNNTFAFAEGGLLLVGEYTDTYSRIFSGNTYLQASGKVGVYLGDRSVALSLEEGTQVLGDTTAMIVKE